MNILKTIVMTVILIGSYGCASRPLTNPQRVLGSRLVPEPPRLLKQIRSHRAEQEFYIMEVNPGRP